MPPRPADAHGRQRGRLHRRRDAVATPPARRARGDRGQGLRQHRRARPGEGSRGLQGRPSADHGGRCRRPEGGASAHAIGRSRGGLTTKVHAAVDALGLPVHLVVTPGQWGDGPQARSLLEGLAAKGRIAHVIADAAYDADHLRGFVADSLGAQAQIKPNPSRADKPSTDWTLYKERNLVERFFNRLKRYRRIALRCEKTLSSFTAFLHIACALEWMR
ncbi:IS5 family transposase [Jannaschia formosa]|nr:IS5 family transposase [Jannaschia formosa]